MPPRAVCCQDPGGLCGAVIKSSVLRRDTYGQGCRFWIAITARPLAILSVKLMAP